MELGLKLMVNKILPLVFFTILLCSCAHLRSGHYYQVKSGDSYDHLSKRFHIGATQLLNLNQNRTLVVGDYLFIPENGGVIGGLLAKIDNRNYSSGEALPSDLGPLVWPVPSSKNISSRFGPRGGRHHDGLDIAARTGTHILAVKKGRVLHQGWVRGYGRMIVISHENGWHTVYAHNKKNFVKKGQWVHQGQVLAQVGQTGRATGPHLHFEIRKGQKAQNPYVYLNSHLKGRKVAALSKKKKAASN